MGKASEPAIRLASVADVPHLPEDDAFFAVRPSTAEVVGGAPVKLADRDARRLANEVASSLPSPWPSRRMLVHAYRYVSLGGGGHEVVELYAGLPVLNALGVEPPIKSISIRRLFLVDHRLVGHEDYGRESGVEERIDTEAPQLTYEHWSWSGTERTVAFVRFENAGVWSRLSTNIGFEGINWHVHELRPGLPETFRRYLYTSH